MDRGERRLIGRWLLLVAMTLLSFESVSGMGWLHDAFAAVVLVIGVAAVKMRIVILDFMEARHAPWLLRGPLELWLLGIAGAILILW